MSHSPRIYISGPIKDNIDYEEDFEQAKATLIMQGWHPVSPADLRSDHWSYGDYMRADILLLLTCESIYMLSGWKNSNGARLEYEIAKMCEMTIVYEALTDYEEET
jgi:hypothetical protein